MIGLKVMICNGGKLQGHIGVVDCVRGERIGVLIHNGRQRIMLRPCEVCIVV